MFDPTAGPARERIDAAEMSRMRSSVVVDERRRRPFYFDGRFLAARDLVREQEYFLARQSDLGRAGGSGVVHGLLVSQGDTTQSLRISAGHGVTPAGELVALPADLRVDLADLPQIQRLDAAFGLLEIPREPARNRTGLYVVGLRPVEFAANPIASYPTSITGQRSVEFGEIVEAVAVTLVPWPEDGTGATAEARHAKVAYEIFVGRGTRGPAAPILPLAMVLLNRGTVQWIDPYLVRRDVGADHGDVLGLGFAPRALREAHLQQYDAHLEQTLALRRSRGQGERFAASEYFQALPPAGRMPAAGIDPSDFTQVFFPPQVQADLSLVPEDELPALLEESLLLPPIDLTAPADAMDSTSVLVLIPVPRLRFRTLALGLGSVTHPATTSVPRTVATRKPMELLQGLRLPRVFVPLPTPQQSSDDAWRNLVPTTGKLWYVRRRNLQYRGDVTGAAQAVQSGGQLVEGVRFAQPRVAPPAPATLLAGAATLLRTAAAPAEGATPGLDATADEAASTGAVSEVMLPGTLPEAVLAAMDALAAEGETVPESAEELRADRGFGGGLARVDAIRPALRANDAALRNLARWGVVRRVDATAAALASKDDLSTLADALEKAAESIAKSTPRTLASVLSSLGAGGTA